MNGFQNSLHIITNFLIQAENYLLRQHSGCRYKQHLFCLLQEYRCAQVCPITMQHPNQGLQTSPSLDQCSLV